MNAAQLYHKMKGAVDFFDLKWSQLVEIEVTHENGRIVFSHDERSTSLPLPERDKGS